MASDPTRIADLRRRVQADPASIAFAQLAEECRRAGDAEEAVRVCRAGLVHHPGYLSARVTMGRALIELGQLDEAARQLTTVVRAAPSNLAAIRGLAEIHRQRGDSAQALAYYQRALHLAQFDPGIEESVEQLSAHVAPTADRFDFDALIAQLEAAGAAAPAPAPLDRPVTVRPSAFDLASTASEQSDTLAAVERDLRERAEQRIADERAARARRDALIVGELEAWLAAIAADRRPHDAA